jgi:hypothetical protein
MKLKLVFFLTFITSYSSSALAQAVLVPPDRQPTVSLAPVQMNKIYQGTEISLRLLRELTTKGKALKAGDRFDLELVDPLKLGEATVVASGSRAQGEIMSVRNKGMFGKSGHFTARLMHLRVGERLIRLAGTFDDKGIAGGWGAAAAIYAAGPLGFFVTGTSAKIEAGTVVKGIIDEDIAVVVSTPNTNLPQP